MQRLQRLRVSARAFQTAGRNGALGRLQAARFASVTGRWAYTVTLAVFAYRHGGASSVAVAGLVRLVPAAGASPFAGAVLARLDAGTVLVWAGLLRAAALAGAGCFALLGGALWPVFVCVGVESALSALLRPIQQSLLPDLCRTPEELTSTNLALSVIESAGVLMGPLAGALLLQNTSVGTVFFAAAGAYLASAVLLLRLAERPSEERSRPGPAEHFLSEALDGLRSAAAHRDTRTVLILYGAQNLVAGALNVLIVVTALRLLDLGQSGVGVLTAAIGIGGLVGGGLVFSRLRSRRYGADLATGLLLWGIPLLLLAFTTSEIAALGLLALVGVGVTVVDVAAITVLQRAAAEETLAHTLALLQAIIVTTVAIGTLATPALVALLGARGALLVIGVPLPLLALTLWRRLRELDDASSSSPWAPLLGENSIFAPLPVSVRERVATELSEVAVNAGDVVIVQGDRGDAFYLLAEGTVDVEVDGSHVRTLGRGDGFGEIALLRNAPRSATVRACGPVKLLRLERHSFLSVVTGNGASSQAAESMIGARLGLSSA